jgi:hypothetical protein
MSTLYLRQEVGRELICLSWLLERKNISLMYVCMYMYICMYVEYMCLCMHVRMYICM